MQKFVAVATALFMACAPQSYAANSVEKLTENNISAFIQTTTDMTTSAKTGESETDLLMYFQEHIRDNASFKSAITYSIPGYPPQEKSLSLTKDEYINSLMQGRDTIDNYETNVEITNIKISKDQRKATVKIASTETGSMLVDGYTERVPVNGRSTCDQILMLSDDDVIQMYFANCKTEISFNASF